MNNKFKAVSLLISAIFLVSLVTVYIFISTMDATTVQTADMKRQPSSTEEKVSAPEPYIGKSVAIGEAFSLKVPNGWKASISTNPSFLAVQFARPGQLESLVYDATREPIIDHNGIPSWSGLTEHFYVRAVSPSQAFDPSRHDEVSSEPFTFSDGTVGRKYLVTKSASEAKKWGGLLKDSEWYGRVFEYKKDGKTIEAHLAFYPSTDIDEAFYESVAKTVRL